MRSGLHEKVNCLLTVILYHLVHSDFSQGYDDDDNYDDDDDDDNYDDDDDDDDDDDIATF
jgi:hypothetical protein